MTSSSGSSLGARDRASPSSRTREPAPACRRRLMLLSPTRFPQPLGQFVPRQGNPAARSLNANSGRRPCGDRMFSRRWAPVRRIGGAPVGGVPILTADQQGGADEEIVGRVAIRGVSKRFGDVTAVDDFTLEVADEEFLVLLGPSGCGKSTALRIIAGLEEPTEGTIEIGDRQVNDVEAKDRDVAMVFQSYALYPHMTVRKNVEFPLKTRRVPTGERNRLVEETTRMLGLETLLERKPAQLSGGQRQRVALARAIVRRPQAFLMDEPLSNLDAKLRVQTRAELVELR